GILKPYTLVKIINNIVVSLTNLYDVQNAVQYSGRYRNNIVILNAISTTLSGIYNVVKISEPLRRNPTTLPGILNAVQYREDIVTILYFNAISTTLSGILNAVKYREDIVTILYFNAISTTSFGILNAVQYLEDIVIILYQRNSTTSGILNAAQYRRYRNNISTQYS
ncbi:hypothetical protein AVEN_119305-1, partial [Araneus ventricosus]